MSAAVSLAPDAGPPWLRPLLDNVDGVRDAYRRRASPQILAAISAASDEAKQSGARRDAAVLVLFSGPASGPGDGGLPTETRLLVTVRASTLRHHAGQAAFPGGASDPGDDGPVGTALREANEETGVDVTRVRPLVTLDRMFIPPSGFHVVPVLAYAPDAGPVAVIDEAETALVSHVPVRAFTNPENRLMVYRSANTRASAGPAFLLNEMLVWGFTGQVISAMLDVAGWAKPWDDSKVVELHDAMAMVPTDNGGPKQL